MNEKIQRQIFNILTKKGIKNFVGVPDSTMKYFIDEGLKKESLPISKIAWDCGFADPNYFARWFRKKVGQSPRQWREGNS